MHTVEAIRPNLLCVQKKRSSQPLLLAFGERLRELRGLRSREEISRRLGALAAPLGGSTLAQYEKGQVWAPDAVVLWALSEIYRVPLTDLTRLLAANRQQPISVNWRDLHCHLPGVQIEPQSNGGSDVASPDQARLQQLAQELEDRDARLREVQAITRQLFRVAIGGKGRTTRKRTS